MHIYQRTLQNMIRAQSKMLKNESTYILSNTLTKQIALFLYYVQIFPMISVDYLINSLKQKNKRQKHYLQSNKLSLRDFINSQTRIINLTFGQNIQKVLLQIIVQSGITFKPKKQNQSRYIENLKMDDKVLNHLLFYLKLNYQHKILCNSKQNIFSITQIARIFNCNEEAIRKLYEIYCKRSKDIQQPNIGIARLIYFVYVIKLRLIICKQLQKADYPTEAQIQTQLLKIRQFYLNQDNQNIENNQYKNRFSVICMNENNIHKLKLSTRNQLISSLKDLACLELNKQKQVQAIQKISMKFNVKKILIAKELKRIKNRQPLKISQLQKKVKQLLQQINYQRWKQPRQFLSKIFPDTFDLGSPSGLEDFYTQHCIPQMIKLRRFQREMSRGIHHYIISRLLECEEVLFIDFSIFYQQQINDYNILLNKKSLIKSLQSRYTPLNDAYLFLVTGVTNKRFLFYSFIEEIQFYFLTYINSIKAIFDKYKQIFPRVIVLNVTMGQKGYQAQRLSNLMTEMQNQGFIVLLSFNQHQEDCNVNFKISNLLRYIICLNCHASFDYNHKKQLTKMVKEIIHSFINQVDFQPFIQDFFKKKYLSYIPKI